MYIFTGPRRPGFSLVCMAFFIALACPAAANNIIVTAPNFTGRDTLGNHIQVRFDMSWENSWRTSTRESNWDAAWIFIKYRTHASYEWQHATLNYSTGNPSSDGHAAPAGGTLAVTSDGRGAFLYASSNLSQQTVNYNDIHLRWNYGADGLSDTSSVELRVFAIEMIYVPQGSFYLGAGGGETYAFSGGASALPFEVSSENSLNLGNTSGDLWAGGNISAATLDAAYPKGYGAFYCMKYEISQGQYADFLNTLDGTQQQSRVEHIVTGSSFSNDYAMTNTASCSARNEIKGMIPPGSGAPVEYASMTPHIACNFLSADDAAAYADWAGLRPMTELEYEKACRGNDGGTAVTPIPNEAAWGDTSAAASTSLNNSGMPNESPGNSSANCAYGMALGGPVRCGAWGGGSRSAAGASWYGILDMSGNLWEMVVNVGFIGISPFYGDHGDGDLDGNGNADVSNWPCCGAMGLRGGSWKTSKDRLRVSDRSEATTSGTNRSEDIGFRAVRTAP